MNPWRYLSGLTLGRYVLWCYLIWWAVVAARYFDPTPRIWATSLGLSAIIGIALTLNARSGSAAAPLQTWPRIRFFIIPFCVSSFAALVKDRHFILIFSPDWREMGIAVAMCVGLGLLVMAAKKHQALSIKH